MSEINIDARMFSIQKDSRMLLGWCAMIKDGKVIYAGRIDDSPLPTTGVFVILHPDDYNSLKNFYKKGLN